MVRQICQSPAQVNPLMEAPMWLVAFLHIFIGSTLAGSLIVVVLVMGITSWVPMLLAAVAGYIAAAPISWLVARKIRDIT